MGHKFRPVRSYFWPYGRSEMGSAMPLPTEHIQFLADSQDAHERRIKSLQTEIRQLQDEVEVHRALLELARNPSTIVALSELLDDSRLNHAVASDPLSYFRDRGVIFQPGSKISITPANENGELFVKGVFVQGHIWYTATWHSVAGFSIGPTSREDMEVGQG